MSEETLLPENSVVDSLDDGGADDVPAPVLGEEAENLQPVVNHQASPTNEVFPCRETLRCKRFFKTEAGLKNHINSWHKSEKKLSCQECGKSFRNMQGLQRHQELHLRPAISCDECDVEVKSQFRLKQHKAQYHTEKSPECHVCGKYFANRASQRDHNKTCFKKLNKLKYKEKQRLI